MIKHKTKALHYILFNKPYGVLSQFTGEPGVKTLKQFGPFPPDVYPAGRLDTDSEGLLILTNDAALQHRLTTPAFAHPRTYLAQVERVPTDDAITRLCKGVVIEGRRTRPAIVKMLVSEPALPTRPVPVRFRKNVPTAWIEIALTEGRNRQVRKMTAAIGHPTLRLVRTKLGFLEWGTLQPGEMRLLTSEEVKKLKASVKLS